MRHLVRGARSGHSRAPPPPPPWRATMRSWGEAGPDPRSRSRSRPPPSWRFGRVVARWAKLVKNKLKNMIIGQSAQACDPAIAAAICLRDSASRRRQRSHWSQSGQCRYERHSNQSHRGNRGGVSVGWRCHTWPAAFQHVVARRWLRYTAQHKELARFTKKRRWSSLPFHPRRRWSLTCAMSQCHLPSLRPFPANAASASRSPPRQNALPI